ncbi:MAG TPA: DUF1345 domain-containing protein [Gaiellaceae bacterium]|jgi:uncharacterized membrane protein|nr:DUF1345 domain-containing protein [Gaiellaceae bacterium]
MTTRASSFGLPLSFGGVALRRLLCCVACGAAVAVVVIVAGGDWRLATSLAWDAAAGCFLLSVWTTALHLDARGTAGAARTEDASRAAADAILIGAAVASLLAVGAVLLDAAGRTGFAKGFYIGLAVVTVVSAWATVHSVFMLRYARLYYSDPGGGISFHADDKPDYRDFAYVAMTIGMTFQVSDTDITAKGMRRTALRHALLSFVFGAVILAITINIVGTLSTAG